MNNQYTLYDFLNEINQEKVAGLNQATNIARVVGGKTLKALNPISTVVSTVGSAKDSAAQVAARQGHADELMGVSGRFAKVAADKEEPEDKRYSGLYKKKKKGLTNQQRALIASGITLGGLSLYGSIKHKDPLWAPKLLNKNKGMIASKATDQVIKHSPLREVGKQINQAVRDGYGTKSNSDLSVDMDATTTDKMNDAIAGGAANGGNAANYAKVFGLALTAGVGKKMGDTLYDHLREQVLAKKFAREKAEQERADAYSKNLKAADLFKKASIATGDDIVTAVNKSVEKFLPEEIKKRVERRNRYNSTVDYVDQGAHGGDAPQRKNK